MSKKIEKAVSKIQQSLITGELVISQACQVRLAALSRRRTVVAGTNSRLIILKRGIFGGHNVTEIRWQDLVDISIFESIFERYLGVTLEIKATTARIKINGLEADEAREVYTFCLKQEQEWQEKNWAGKIEKACAKASGIVIGSEYSQRENCDRPPLGRLSVAKQMFDDGLISDSEYESIKSKITEAI